PNLPSLLSQNCAGPFADEARSPGYNYRPVAMNALGLWLFGDSNNGLDLRLEGSRDPVRGLVHLARYRDLLLRRNRILSDNYPPEKNEATNCEQQVYISRSFGCDFYHSPCCEHQNRCDDSKVHLYFR